jgi:hypothetical protein
MPQCTLGHDVAPGSAFCDVCFNPILPDARAGTAQPSSVPAGLLPCPNPDCRTPQDPNLKFCEMCGADLVAAPVPVSVGAMAPPPVPIPPSPPPVAPMPVTPPTPPRVPVPVSAASAPGVMPASVPPLTQEPKTHQRTHAMRARLLVMSEPAATIADLEAPCQMSLGRSDAARQFQADINFDSLLAGGGRAAELGVSREHAYIEGREDGSWQIEHGGSSNSVWVNEQTRLRTNGESVRLENGARIRLGNLELRFEMLA